jgi:hypothetical protein
MPVDSVDSDVSDVLPEVAEAFDGIVPSHEPPEDWAENWDAFRTASALAVAELMAGKEGFLKSPFTEPLGFTVREDVVLEPCGVASDPYGFLSGVEETAVSGALGSGLDDDASDSREVDFFNTGVFMA